jgi:hypothetical protein
MPENYGLILARAERIFLRMQGGAYKRIPVETAYEVLRDAQFGDHRNNCIIVVGSSLRQGGDLYIHRSPPKPVLVVTLSGTSSGKSVVKKGGF